MQRTYNNCNSGELLARFLLRREKMLRNRRYRNNVMDFMTLLSHYIPQKTVAEMPVTKGLYEFFCKRHAENPYSGFAVSVAIERLPVKLKKTVKK